MFTWQRYGGYEVSTQGDKRFSAMSAVLSDGRTIEQHYQCDIKGYCPGGTDWRLGKGKPPLDKTKDLYKEYKKLWQQWADMNQDLMWELRQSVGPNKVLSDRFATTPVNQARALAELLNEEEMDMPNSPNNEFKLIVAGSRGFNDYSRLSEVLTDLAEVVLEKHEVSIISGCAKGADALGMRFARENEVMLYLYPANWNQHGKSAGYIRNRDMADVADGALIFWDGKSPGTEHMIRLMKGLQRPVWIERF